MSTLTAPTSPRRTATRRNKPCRGRAAESQTTGSPSSAAATVEHVVKRAARAHSPYFTAFGANFALVASVNLVGDQVESSVAHTLRRLEREVERDRTSSMPR
jgi:hypothetical protein